MSIRVHIRTELELDRVKFFAIGALFLFFGISSVISQMYMPEILALSGLEIVNLPDPSVDQILVDFWGDVSLLAMIIILFMMSTFSAELDINKSGYFYLARPVSRRQYYLTRFLLRVGGILGIFFTSSMLIYGYAIIYFDPLNLGKVMLAALFLSLNIAAIAALVIALSSAFSSSTSGVIGLISVFLQLLLGLVEPLKWLSPFALSNIWQEVIAGTAATNSILSHLSALFAWIIIPGILGLIYYQKRDLY